ncbi:MAG: hypothetical protein R2711_07500 [Acidimicrobiales bacterium]
MRNGCTITKFSDITTRSRTWTSRTRSTCTAEPRSGASPSPRASSRASSTTPRRARSGTSSSSSTTSWAAPLPADGIPGDEAAPPEGAAPGDLRTGVDACLALFAQSGVLDRTCASPLGFEWTVGQAVAGTFMDVLIHTWDLATATGQDATLDPELVAACTAMFLPDMPENGRAAGLIGPAVEVGADATPQQILLGALGRRG